MRSYYTFIETLREAVRESDLSLRDFAERIGVSEDYLRSIFAGVEFPERRTLDRIISQTDMTPELIKLLYWSAEHTWKIIKNLRKVEYEIDFLKKYAKRSLAIALRSAINDLFARPEYEFVIKDEILLEEPKISWMVTVFHLNRLTRAVNFLKNEAEPDLKYVFLPLLNLLFYEKERS